MPEIWLTDIEQTKKILVLEESIKELRAELNQLRTDYGRTREIVDELVVKFLGHAHAYAADFQGNTKLIHFTLSPVK